jgi:hypothetical protein
MLIRKYSLWENSWNDPEMFLNMRTLLKKIMWKKKE